MCLVVQHCVYVQCALLLFNVSIACNKQPNTQKCGPNWASNSGAQMKFNKPKLCLTPLFYYMVEPMTLKSVHIMPHALFYQIFQQSKTLTHNKCMTTITYRRHTATMHLQLLLCHHSSLHFTSFSICYYVQQCQILVGKKCIFLYTK